MGVCTLLVLLASCFLNASSSSQIFTAVRFYFKEEPALHAYLCRREDAFEIMNLAVEGRFVMTRHTWLIDEVLHDISFEKELVPRKGIFVDMRCSEGASIIKRVFGRFNDSFSWLLWTDQPSEALKLLQNSRVSVDSRLTVATPQSETPVFINVYRNHVEGQFILTKIMITADSIYKVLPPRNNFNGYRFSASTVLSEFTFRGREDEETFMNPNYLPYVAGFRRYSYSMLYLLSYYYNFDFDMKVYTKWHTIFPNGTATGMLKDLITSRRDFGMAASKYIGERLDLVSFLGVLGSVTFFLAFRQPVALGSVNALVAPMSVGAWISFFCACAVCGFVLCVLLMKDKSTTDPYQWKEGLFIIFSTIAQQSIEFTGNRNATRIALLTVMVLTFIANILYNTSVLNGLLIKAPDAIQNAEQLLASDLKISSNNVGYLRNQMEANDSLTKSFKEKLLKSDKVYVSLEEGICLVKSGRYAFYVLDDDFYRASSNMLRVEEICTTSTIQKEKPFPTGIYGVKDSPYREHFRRGITYLGEIGLLSYLSTAFRASKPECIWSLETEPFGLKPLGLAYIVLISGFIGSIFVLICEHVYRRVMPQNAEKILQRESISYIF